MGLQGDLQGITVCVSSNVSNVTKEGVQLSQSTLKKIAKEKLRKFVSGRRRQSEFLASLFEADIHRIRKRLDAAAKLVDCTTLPEKVDRSSGDVISIESPREECEDNQQRLRSLNSRLKWFEPKVVSTGSILPRL